MEAFLEHRAENTLILGGVWDFSLPKSLLNKLQKCKNLSSLKILLDSSFDLDFCGGEVLYQWNKTLHNTAKNELLEHKKVQKIFQLLAVQQNIEKPTLKDNFFKLHSDSFKIIGNFCKKNVELLSFLGEIIYFFFYTFLNPTNFRIKTTFYHIQESLIKAVGIVALACFLIGIVVAYQGSIQLRQFGASILIVEMSSMLTLREMAPIITAIIIAGRSASAFSAEIGMMRATQEMDAMKVMGFNPITFLVLPRLIALVCVMPLVVFISDVFGLLGAMLISQLQLDISTEQFIERFSLMVSLRHFWVGIIKAPFFGLIIALVGCYYGFSANKDTRSIGINTTKSVVISIFCVIAFDALCSILFTELGL
ncbi:MlaE family ABC transporter permease [Helicobacter burdigaliensis]|uniref:MlaE family ABC transporter permease n=1 Tax=Helicobacter burdigaliensis TaxID=2315334 RepID=UPI000EF75656|nr:ABC transporter permease [Helicobacter burdigaliensis]